MGVIFTSFTLQEPRVKVSFCPCGGPSGSPSACPGGSSLVTLQCSAAGGRGGGCVLSSRTSFRTAYGFQLKGVV